MKSKRLLVLLAVSVLAALILLVLWAAGVFSGDEREDPFATQADTTAATAPAENQTTQPTTQAVTPPVVYRVGYNSYGLPPFIYANAQGELIGYDIDFLNLVGNLIHAQFEYVPISWADGAQALANGEIDILIGGLRRASLDESQVAFTDAYQRNDIVLLMPEDRDYNSFEDLTNTNVCVLNNTAAFYYANTYQGSLLKVSRLFSPPEYQSVLGAFSDETMDCIITDQAFAAFMVRETGEAFLISQPLYTCNMAAAVRQTDTELLAVLNSAISSLSQDGSLAKLEARWLD